MALARYIEKAGLSAASMLQKFDATAFENQLASENIALIIGPDALEGEGRILIEMLSDLLARLYPLVTIVTPDAGERARLVSRLRAINARIDVGSELTSATVAVCVGTASEKPNCPTLFVGSDGWLMKFAALAPQLTGTSANPFGAAGAACVASAWVFATVFRSQLTVVERNIDPDWMRIVSLLDFTTGPGASNPTVERIDIEETHLAGVGAIGNAVVWVLARMPLLTGTLRLVDPQEIELTNLQRYVLAAEAGVGVPKVSRAVDEFGLQGSPLDVRPYQLTWDEYVSANPDTALGRLLLALDTADDRIRAQASLPKWIANAWTQPENIGVSRHEFLGPGPCVACLYIPNGPRKSKDQLVCDALGITADVERMHVRALLHSGAPIGEPFVRVIAERIGVDPTQLLPFADNSLAAFYTREVCGGRLLTFGSPAGASQAQVPLAFQSAFAGIMLAVELIVDSATLRSKKLPARTELDLLRHVFAFDVATHTPATKPVSGRCICQDEWYQRAYQQKHALLTGE